MTEIKKEDVEKMIVWNENENSNEEAYVVCKSAGYYWGVKSLDHFIYNLNDINILHYLTRWEHAKPIPKEEWRPFNPEELGPTAFFYVLEDNRTKALCRIQQIEKDSPEIQINNEWYTLEEFYNYFRRYDFDNERWVPAGVKK